MNGRAEDQAYYAELAYDLHEQGYAVYLYDHRGQGQSDRILKNSHVGYVDRFGDYVHDFADFMNTVVAPTAGGETFLIAHSMGAAVATRAVELGRVHFAAAVLSSPMFEVQVQPWGWPLAFWFADLANFFGQGQHYAPGESDPGDDPFSANLDTHSQVRWEQMNQVDRESLWPVIGGVSNRWLREAIAGGWRAEAEARKFSTPVVVLQATEDSIVVPGAEKKFCDAAPDCHLLSFAGAGHMIFMEQDAIRDVAYKTTLSFFSSQQQR